MRICTAAGLLGALGLFLCFPVLCFSFSSAASSASFILSSFSLLFMSSFWCSLISKSNTTFSTVPLCLQNSTSSLSVVSGGNPPRFLSPKICLFTSSNTLRLKILSLIEHLPSPVKSTPLGTSSRYSPTKSAWLSLSLLKESAWYLRQHPPTARQLTRAATRT